jgi:hypothetical protein
MNIGSRARFTTYLGMFVGIFFFAMLPGCMTVSNKQALVENNSTVNLAGQQVALLPVKAQTSLTPDSVLALRNEINKRLGQALREKLTASIIVDIATSADLLNQHDALPALEQLISSYDNTGIIDKRQTKALGAALGSRYLMFTRLKAEKLDMAFLVKGMAASLEIMILDANTGGIAWSGSSEWKRGGIFGFGGSTAEDAASHLVTLSLSTLQQSTGVAQPPISTPVAPIEEAEKPVAKPHKPKKNRKK